jgi:hypothetical protein
MGVKRVFEKNRYAWTNTYNKPNANNNEYETDNAV